MLLRELPNFENVVKMYLKASIIVLFFLCIHQYYPVTSTTMRIDLSSRGLRKEDFFTKTQHQIDIGQVEELILRDNHFDRFMDCAAKLTKLRVLDLSQNRLEHFFFLCKNEYNLQVLNVSHNQLEYLRDTALNERTSSIKTLDLSFNKLIGLNSSMFEHMKDLHYLSVSSNPIADDIEEFIFDNHTSLHHLHMSNISATFFSSRLFLPLTNLTSLDISWNNIDDVPALPSGLQKLDISGTKITRLSSMNLPELVELYMNHMPYLSTILLNHFENMEKLEILSMHGCKRLSQLKISPPQPNLLPRMQKLSVHSCALETLNPELLPIIQNTLVLDLQNNPWCCDCHMKWVNAMNLTIDLREGLKCASPIEHRDKFLLDVPAYELQCNFGNDMITPIAWTCLSILILGLLVAGIAFLCRGVRREWPLLRRGSQRDTDVSYTNVIDSSNDLVRILAEGEKPDRNDE